MEDVKESKIEENSCTTNDDGEADEMCEADEKCEVNESEDVEMVDAEANSEAEANSIDAEANSVDAEANSVDAEANSVDAEANSVDAETNSVDAEGNSQDAKKVCDVEKNDTKPSEPVVPETHTHTTRLKTGTITLKPVTERKKRHKRLRRFSNRSSSSSSSSIGNHLKNSESIGRENLRPRRQRTVPDSELNGSISSESEDFTKHSKNGKNNGSASCSDQAIEIKEIDQLENKIRDYMEMKFKKDTPELRERLCSDEKIPQSKDAINKSEDKPQTIIVTETKSLAQVINNAVRKDMCSSQEGKPTLVIIETKTPAAEISSLPKTQTVTNTITVETGLGKSNMSGSLTSVPLGTSSQMKSMYNASNGGSAAASAVEDGGMAVEVPSLVVPYLIEYPPSRTISEFLKMLPLNAQELKEIEEASKTKSYGNYLSSPSGPISTVGSSQPYGAYGNPIGRPKTADRWGAYFESSLGKFFVDIGLNLAKEWVQNDLVKSQRRKIEKQIKPGQQEINMGALMKTLEETKEKNDPYHFSLKKCQICNFKTESLIVMKNHYSYPHEKHMDYLCNFCKFRTRLPQAAKFHMEAEHGVQARLERPICFYHCPLCEFEDNSKGKVTKHSFKCQKKFIPERNMAPPPEFDPPAKRQKVFPIVPPGMSSGATNKYNVPVSSYAQKSKLSIRPKDMKMPMSGGYRQMNCGGNNMGNMYYRSGNMMYPQSSSSRGSMSQSPVFLPSNQPLVVNQMLQSSQQYQSNQIYQVLNNSGHMMPVVGGNINQMSNPRFTLLPTASNNSSSMQGPTPVALVPNIATSTPSRSVLMSGGMGSSSQRIQTPKPNISITPVTKSSAPQSRTRLPTPSTSMVKLGAQNSSFVVCEICDGYIKDLEQLRTHMQWIHKVKIHPKMIFNRPPLNCQKCQFRFFTDQGLERHLLGAHGLVTSSMQENANKGQDSGRCTICGKVFQWKLLAHMSKDHNMILKPAHLSYKCTVCAATFGMYKLFETHVYQAHSTVAKRVLDTPDEKKKPQQNVKPDTKADSSPLTVHLECSECGEKFAKKANLMQHWEKHHLGEKKETKRNDNDDEEDDDDDDKDDVAVIEMETNSREKETTEDGDQDETALDMEVESHDVEHPSPCSVHTDEEEVDGDDEEDDDDGGQC